MTLANTGIWAKGSVAGLLGAVVLALWFLLIDAAQGTPFHTPSLLASSLFGIEGLEARPGLIALYTLVHFAAFVVTGILVTWVFAKVSWGPSLIFGVVLGFILFDLAFYSSIYVTGIDVVQELGWVEVLSGNILAGLALVGYLNLTGTGRPVTWWGSFSHHRVVREGAIAGVIGAVAVAIWFLLFDLLQGRAFFTPGALGSALFLGASSVEEIQIGLWTVFGYSVVHLGAFLLVGLIASAIAWEVENTPTVLLGAILLFVAFEAFFLGLLAVVAEFLLGPIAWWSIAIGNVLAVAAIGGYLWKRHPRLAEALQNPFDQAA